MYPVTEYIIKRNYLLVEKKISITTVIGLHKGLDTLFFFFTYYSILQFSSILPIILFHVYYSLFITHYSRSTATKYNVTVQTCTYIKNKLTSNLLIILLVSQATPPIQGKGGLVTLRTASCSSNQILSCPISIEI